MKHRNLDIIAVLIATIALIAAIFLGITLDAKISKDSQMLQSKLERTVQFDLVAFEDIYPADKANIE